MGAAPAGPNPSPNRPAAWTWGTCVACIWSTHRKTAGGATQRASTPHFLQPTFFHSTTKGVRGPRRACTLHSPGKAPACGVEGLVRRIMAEVRGREVVCNGRSGPPLLPDGHAAARKYSWGLEINFRAPRRGAGGDECRSLCAVFLFRWLETNQEVSVHPYVADSR